MKNTSSALPGKTKKSTGVTSAPTDAKRRGRPRSEEAATAILDAAYRLSAAEGLKGATMQAIALETGVSKMTIYKWWGNRLHLLIDAFLRQTTMVLPISETDSPTDAIHAHAARYVVALHGDLGRVQMAVLAECMGETGNADLFVERYLSIRRKLGTSVIKRGQKDGSIRSTRPAEQLYDQIYGSIFYRFLFGLKGLDKPFVRSLIDITFDH